MTNVRSIGKGTDRQQVLLWLQHRSLQAGENDTPDHPETTFCYLQIHLNNNT